MTAEILLQDFKPNETRRIWKNIVIIALAFMVHFTAHSGASYLQSSINADAGLGTTALASFNAGIVLSNIFLPSIVIKLLGAKWTVFTCFILYMPYIASQLYPRFYTLVPAAFLVGLAAGPLWCAKSGYLVEIAQVHSVLSLKSADMLLQRFLSRFFMIYEMNQVWGNLISSLVLSSGNNTAAVTSLNETMIPLLCGSNFLISDSDEEVLQTQPREQMVMMIGIYLICIACAALIVAVGLDSLKRYKSRTKSSTDTVTGLPLLAVTLKHLANTNQLLLLAITIFIGQHNAFFGADFTASFVSCAVGTGTVGFVVMTFGLSNAIGCFLTNILVKVSGRVLILLAAVIVHGSVFVALLLWRVQVGQEYILFIIAVFWGLCDSVWTVQMNTYYGILFRENKEAAFSNYRLWEATGYIISYSISSHLRTRYKVYLLIFNMLLGFMGYLIVEWRQHRTIRRKRLPLED